MRHIAAAFVYATRYMFLPAFRNIIIGNATCATDATVVVFQHIFVGVVYIIPGEVQTMLDVDELLIVFTGKVSSSSVSEIEQVYDVRHVETGGKSTMNANYLPKPCSSLHISNSASSLTTLSSSSSFNSVELFWAIFTFETSVFLSLIWISSKSSSSSIKLPSE